MARLRLNPLSPNGVSFESAINQIAVNNSNSSSTSSGVISYGLEHPATAENGTLFYDTDDAILYIYINGWIEIGSGTPPVTTGQPIGLLLGLTRAS